MTRTPRSSPARTIFERKDSPSLMKVGILRPTGSCSLTCSGNPPDFRAQFLTRVRDAATRHELPEDALAFAEARRRQTEIRSAQHTRRPTLSYGIDLTPPQSRPGGREKRFDLKKMEEVDRRTAGPLKAIFDQYGVPTYDMVGVQAAKDFVVMVQHQPPEFRLRCCRS